LKYFFTAIILLASFTCFGQRYLRSNEQLILSFTTTNNKQAYLVKDKANQYIAYRFGTENKIEFEFPDTAVGSWSKFTYSYYLRGGGPANEGMDLNYVYFTNNGFRYVIYQTYHSVGNKTGVGIKVIDTRTSKTIDIKGDINTRKGTLTEFRDNGLLLIGEELFE
jgi:hypothetical protein